MQEPDTEHVVAVCGSERDGSHTRTALEHTLEAAAGAGATTDLVDLAALDLPTFDPEQSDVGDGPDLRERIAEADAVVLGSPMYHGSYASPLKTALDYCGFDEFEATTVGLLVVAGGGFPTPALEHLRSVVRALDAWVLPHQVGIPNADAVVEDGELTDDAIAERVATLGTQAVAYAGVETYPETTATACAVPTAD